MTLTPQMIQAMNKATGMNVSTTGTPKVTSRADEIRALAKKATAPAPVDTSYSPASQAKKALSAAGQTTQNIGQDVAGAFKGGVEKAKAGYEQAANSGGNPLVATEGALKMGSGILGAAFSPLAPVTAPIGHGVSALTDKISDRPDVQALATSPAGERISRGAEDIVNLADITGAVAGIKAAPSVATKTGNVASNVGGKIQEGIESAGTFKNPLAKTPTQATAKSVSKITDLYNRAIRPTVAGKSNAGQIAKSQADVMSGLKAIAENKPNLSFTNAEGETLSGATPKSVDHLTQSIAQTKKNIFNQYDSLAKQAGETGNKVNTSEIASELNPVILSKSLEIANPSAVKYAKDIQNRLHQAGEIDFSTAQDVVQHYNDALKAFYRNPSYETASTASIDALIANKFREALDKGISGATGEQYQALKNQYGALSAMEKDVAHRNVVWGRQNNVGLGANIANIASGAELARGLITMNPADIAASLAIKGTQKYIKYLNNPDVGVSKIFSEIEKLNRPSKGSTLESTGGNIKSEPYQNGTTESPNPSIPKKGKGEIPPTISKDTSLTGNDAKVQEASIKKYESNPQKMVDDYIQKNGNVANTDLARREFADVGYVGTNSPAVQEASSALTKKVWKQILKDSPESESVIYAGGSGVGKSSSLSGFSSKEVPILDGNLSSMKTAQSRIAESIEAGKFPNIAYVYREPVDAWLNGVVKRMIHDKEELGRVVPLSEFVNNHNGSLETIKTLYKSPMNGQDYRVTLVDNSKGTGNHSLLSPQKLDTLKYPSDLKSTLLKETKKLYDNGTITKDQYEALIK